MPNSPVCERTLTLIAVAMAVTVQSVEAQEGNNSPRDRTVREIADRTFPPACAGRECGRQRFAIKITTTETDSARIEWAMKDAVFYDTPRRADAVLVYVVDKWPGGKTVASGEYSPDGCGWAGSRDGSGCGGATWKILKWGMDAPIPGSGPRRSDTPTWSYAGREVQLRRLAEKVIVDGFGMVPEGLDAIPGDATKEVVYLPVAGARQHLRTVLRWADRCCTFIVDGNVIRITKRGAGLSAGADQHIGGFAPVVGGAAHDALADGDPGGTPNRLTAPITVRHDRGLNLLLVRPRRSRGGRLRARK